MGDIVPREELSKQGLKGFGGIAGGVGVLVLKGIAAGGVLGGLIVGGIVGVAGLLLARSKDDKNAGYVALAAGGLTILAVIPVLKVIAGPLLWVSGIGLLLAGGWSLVKFFRNLRTRNV